MTHVVDVGIQQRRICVEVDERLLRRLLQIADEKEAVAQYGSSDSGASLGDILGAALKEAQSKTKKK